MAEFHVDVTICVTAYVEADTEEEAKALFLVEYGEADPAKPPMLECYIGPMNKQVYVNGEITLSPVATSYGFNPREIEEL